MADSHNRVEIDRNKVREYGGSLYVLLPKVYRDRLAIRGSDTAVWSATPGDENSLILTIEKSSNGDKPNPDGTAAS